MTYVDREITKFPFSQLSAVSNFCPFVTHFSETMSPKINGSSVLDLRLGSSGETIGDEVWRLQRLAHGGSVKDDQSGEGDCPAMFHCDKLADRSDFQRGWHCDF